MCNVKYPEERNLLINICILIILILLDIFIVSIYDTAYAAELISDSRTEHGNFDALPKRIGDLACGSGLLNSIVRNNGKKDMSDFFKGRFDKRRYYKYYDKYASVYWSGPYNRQHFRRHKDLKMATIESLDTFQETRFLTKLSRKELENILKIDKGYISREFDNILPAGPVTFLYFKDERASRLIVDCGQSIESD